MVAQLRGLAREGRLEVDWRWNLYTARRP